MLIRPRVRLLITLLTASILSGCYKGYVYNDSPSGPIFVKPTEPEAAPATNWQAPKHTKLKQLKVLSVPEQNKRAIEVFKSKGFEAVSTEKGVVVYLPSTIYFNTSESSISLEARNKITEIAQELIKPYLSKRFFEVSGHTDSGGSEAINMALSKARSLAATAVLVSSKVPKTRLSSTWFGESRLRAQDYNSDGSINTRNRKLNRRVEFTILNPE